MKKIILNKATSDKAKGTYYSGVVDIADIAAVAEWKYKNGHKVAEVQRKKSKKHVQKIIASLKKEKELFVWNLLIAVMGSLSIQEEEIYNKEGEMIGTMHYIMWPETDEEMAEFAKFIEISDGQHRCEAFFAINGLRELLGAYDVTIAVLDHPETVEVLKQFRALNGRGKSMSKELLFEFDAQIGDLDKDKAEARELLVMANQDPTNPMCGKFKFGETSGMSSNTIVNRWISGSTNIIEEMNAAGFTTAKMKYQLMSKMMKAFDEVNHINDAKAKVKYVDLSATKYGATLATILPSVLKLHENGKNVTVANIQSILQTLYNKIYLVDRISASDNRAITYHYQFNGSYGEITIQDRWNGAAKVDPSIASGKRLLEYAYFYPGTVKAAEVVNA